MYAGPSTRVSAADEGRLWNLGLGKTMEGVRVHASPVRAEDILCSPYSCVPKDHSVATGLFDDLETGLEDLEEASSHLGELISEPGQDGNGSEGSEADIEVAAKFVGFCVSNAAEDGVPVHLREDPDEAAAEEDHQKGEAPVDELMRLE